MSDRSEPESPQAHEEEMPEEEEEESGKLIRKQVNMYPEDD